MNKKKIISVIPARGGSKRIPRKNIREIAGKPMIAWVIEELKKCNFIDDILVSTDDVEIRDYAISLGVSAPFMRPSELSDDFATTSSVSRHATEWYEKNVETVDYVVTVYPTAVLLTSDKLHQAYDKIVSEEWETVFSVTTFPFPIQRAIFKNDEGLIEMFQPEMFHQRSQDLKEAYHDAGQFYFSTTKAVLEEIPAFGNRSGIILLPRYQVADIDTEEDFIIAENLLRSF